VHVGENVRRGQQIATVGTGGGRYFAHLHFEMREFITPFIGPGYRVDTRGWLDPHDIYRGASQRAARRCGPLRADAITRILSLRDSRTCSAGEGSLFVRPRNVQTANSQ